MRERPPKQQGIVLENREVVALVVGSLVVLGVVFYLGVSVGKGLAPEPQPVVERSLDALDRQAEESLEVELTFAEKLTEEPKPARVEPPREEPKAEPAPPKPKPDRKPAEKAKAEEKPRPAPEPLPETETVARAAEPPAVQGAARFSVQLASFPSREEADAYAARLREAGLSPRIVEAEIPEKGLYYRVRVGSFDSRDQANLFLEDLRREGRFDGIVMPMDG